MSINETSPNRSEAARRAFREVTPITDAINEGIRDALIRHKRLRQPVVAWRDGRVVWLAPDEIPVVDDGRPL